MNGGCSNQQVKPGVDRTKPFWLVYLTGLHGAWVLEVATVEEAVASAQEQLRSGGATRTFIAPVTKAFELPVKQVDLSE